MTEVDPSQLGEVKTEENAPINVKVLSLWDAFRV